MNEIKRAWILGILLLSLALMPMAFGNANAWLYCATADITDPNVAKVMKQFNCEVHSLQGDYYGKEKSVLGSFKEPNIPVLADCGNHDDCSKVLRYDGMKFKSYPFLFKHKNACIISLNTETSINKQKNTATNMMRDCQEDPKIDVIIVKQHKPAITNPTAHHKENEAKGYRDVFIIWNNEFPKFVLVIFGHNHGWQICEPESPNVTAITDGTGGRDPYPWGSKMDDNCKGNLSGSKYNGFTTIEIGNETIEEIKHINVKQMQ